MLHPMQKRSSKNPRDVNQFAKLIVDQATGEAPEEVGQVGQAAFIVVGRPDEYLSTPS
jgi:hypothetical protein